MFLKIFQEKILDEKNFMEILFGKENNYEINLSEFHEIKEDYDIYMQRNLYKDPYFLCIKEKPSFKAIIEQFHSHEDKYPFLLFRKYMSLIYKYYLLFQKISRSSYNFF